MEDGTMTAWMRDMQERLRFVEREEPRRLLLRFLSAELDMSRTDLILNAEQLNLSSEILERLEAKIDRLVRGEPLAYVTGTQTFYGLDFKVTPDVLIPRPDSEVLIEAVEGMMGEFNGPVRVLDIGTGSGALIISIAHLVHEKGLRDWTFHATDISQAALRIAEHNARHLIPELTIVFEHADLWPRSGRYDLIISNPPYITADAYRNLDRSVRSYEPAIALQGGQDGLDIYRRLIEGIPDYLAPEGSIIFEIGWDQGESVSSLLKNAGYNQVEVGQDYGGRDRFVLVHTGNH